MAKAVFTTKPNPTYDDLPEVRYHFPGTYLNQARAAIGDWILYYEPRRASDDASSRGGRQAYFAVARVIDIEPDNNSANHYYANVTDYVGLDQVVPFRSGQHYYESALQRDDGQTSKGAFGRAVRTIPDREFESILAAGFATTLASDAAADETPEALPVQRPLIQTTLTKPFRDQAFRRQVRLAYDNRCAISGLRFIDDCGRPEVHAAHIRPVASAGPDSVRNGFALSGTLHWMFDRGIISLDDNFGILLATDITSDVQRLIHPSRKAFLPKDKALCPHRSFLQFHRAHVFKGSR
jgi:putative restriction endonuclease